MGGEIIEGFNEINYWKTVPDKIRLEILNKSISDGDSFKDSRKKRKNNQIQFTNLFYNIIHVYKKIFIYLLLLSRT